VFWGTERQGTDLTHVASREGIGTNAAWHLQHFKSPRGLSPGSLMPSFDYLSEAELQALIAYMFTLK
jgi:cbb3-type cytochrome oxidase cytochrome c subunit